MMTKARPIAIRKSLVQTRISLSRVCEGAGRPVAVDSERSLLTPGVNWLAAREDDAGAGVSGDVEVAGCFSSSLSILRRLVFIAWPLRPAPDAIYRFVSEGKPAVLLYLLLRFAEPPARCSAISSTEGTAKRIWEAGPAS